MNEFKGLKKEPLKSYMRIIYGINTEVFYVNGTVVYLKVVILVTFENIVLND